MADLTLHSVKGSPLTYQEVDDNFTALNEDSDLLLADAYSVLRLLSVDSTKLAYTKGHTTAGDGGHGAWRGVTGAAPGTYTDNNGTIIVPTGGDGSAAWLRLLQNGGLYDIRWWGKIGNSSTGDDATFQAAIDAMHKLSDDSGIFGELTWRGAIYTTSPKKFGKGLGLVGQGDGFVSQIIPLSTYSDPGSIGVIAIDGDFCTGGWVFRQRHFNYTINTTGRSKAQVPKVMAINKAYNISIDSVWCYESYGTAIYIRGSNEITLFKPRVYGNNAVSTVSEYGIRCVGEAGGSQGGITIIQPDIEVCFIAVSQEADSKVTVAGGHAERNIVGWSASGNSSGSFTVQGGLWESPGASGIAARILGHNVKVIGGKYVATGGAGLTTGYATTKPENCHIIGADGDVADSRNWLTSWARKGLSLWHRSLVPNTKVCSDNVATSFYRVTIPQVGNNYCTVDIDVAAQIAGYSAWTGRYRVGITHPGTGNPTVTSVVEYGKTNINASGNYGLSVTVAASIASATQVDLQITANSSGALGEGLNVRVNTNAEFWQNKDDGSIYIQVQ